MISDVHYPILRYFEYGHLPPNLQAVSKPFCDLAILMAGQLPVDLEVAECLRHLLIAKDAAVRAALG